MALRRSHVQAAFLVLSSLVLALSLPERVEAQEESGARNLMYIELFGNALYFGSINYERMLAPRLSARVGVSPVGAFPVMANYLAGRGDHRLEAGIGLLAGASEVNTLGTATLGYRYQPQVQGMVFRAGWTPLLGRGEIGFWFGVSAGYTW